VPKREQIKKPAPQERKAEEIVEPKEQDAEALKDASDELLDEIDALLEDQEVLVNYRQKGGQ
jgi:hypothetical protein